MPGITGLNLRYGKSQVLDFDQMNRIMYWNVYVRSVLQVLDSTGHFLFKFGSAGGNDGQMKHPRGVCVDPNDNIVVADQDNNRVTLFTPEGKFIRHIIKIQKPWGVALNAEGVMAVTQKPSLCVFKVFEPKF